jgi:rhodanese-related sulfurtransferase
MSDISPQESRDWAESGAAVLIDVREPNEFEAERIDGAVNIPVSAFDAQAVLRHAGARKIVFYCRSGMRAANMLERFAMETGRDAVCMAGSIMAWKQQGLPTVAGQG